MPRNVEIKARLEPSTLGAIRKRAAELSGGPAVELLQRDTFFHARSGRLKLRELGDGRAELIAYARADRTGPKLSSYVRAPVSGSEDGLREALTRALGVRIHVDKRRELYQAGRTRIHIDEVRDLGPFLELEVVLEDGEPIEVGEREAHELLADLGVEDSALVPDAYADLLERAH